MLLRITKVNIAEGGRGRGRGREIRTIQQRNYIIISTIERQINKQIRNKIEKKGTFQSTTLKLLHSIYLCGEGVSSSI